MVLLGLALSIQSSILVDSRLSSPLDFDKNLSQIADFCKEVSALSGVQLSVAKNIQDLKVDVFVDKKPLNETLDKVAKVLNCEWVPVDKGYRLEMSAVNVNRERNFVQAEEDDELETLKLKVWACEYAAKNSPYLEQGKYEFREMQQQRTKLSSQFLAEIDEASKTKDATKVEAAMARYQFINQASTDLTFGRAVSQFQGADWARFWKGEPFAACSLPNSTYKLYSSDHRIGGQTYFEGPDGKKQEADHEQFSFFRFDPILKRVQMNEMEYTIWPLPSGLKTLQSSSHGNGGFVSMSSFPGIAEHLKKMPFFVDLKPWMDTLETPKRFDRTIDVKTKEWKSPWIGGTRRLGDHLRWIHQATGVPVVAQADRSSLYSWNTLNQDYKGLSNFGSRVMNEQRALVREDSGFLMAKNFRYWSRRKHECPESVWTKFQPAPESTTLTLDEYVSLAKQVRLDQLQTGEIGYPVSTFSVFAPIQCFESLKLYGTLDSTQQNLARKSEGLSLQQLSGSQQTQFRKAILNLILETGSLSYDLAKALIRSGIGDEQLEQFRLLIDERDENGGVIISKDGRKPTDGKAKTFNFISFNYQLTPKELVSESIRLRK